MNMSTTTTQAATRTVLTVEWIWPGELGYKPSQGGDDPTTYRVITQHGKRFIVQAHHPRARSRGPGQDPPRRPRRLRLHQAPVDLPQRLTEIVLFLPLEPIEPKETSDADTESQTPTATSAVIELERPDQTLRCRAEACTGSPLSPTSGWHMVSALVEERPFSGPSLFVCTAHLTLAEDTLARHMARELRDWQIQTYRMHGWVEDGRGPLYIAAAGGGDPTLF